MTEVVVRAATASDRDLLVDALVWASDWRGDRGLSATDVSTQREAWHYVDGWMRPHDFGVVAEVQGTPRGAAWARVMPVDDPGYGFVDEKVLELTIGVNPDRRGQGVGRLLMTALVDTAHRRNVPGLSLSVEDGNVAARRLYESCGFIVAGRVGGSDTMVLWF